MRDSVDCKFIFYIFGYRSEYCSTSCLNTACFGIRATSLLYQVEWMELLTSDPSGCMSPVAFRKLVKRMQEGIAMIGCRRVQALA